MTMHTMHSTVAPSANSAAPPVENVCSGTAAVPSALVASTDCFLNKNGGRIATSKIKHRINTPSAVIGWMNHCERNHARAAGFDEPLTCPPGSLPPAVDSNRKSFSAAVAGELSSVVVINGPVAVGGAAVCSAVFHAALLAALALATGTNADATVELAKAVASLD